MKHPPLVHCIVLTMNGKELLLETLESLQKMTYPNFKLVVVDNGSTDGSQQAVRSQYPEAEIIENGENLGVMEGYNVGMRYSLHHDGDWTFLLNNDISVDPNLLSELMSAASMDKTIGILAPKIYYHKEPNTFWYAGGLVNYFTGIISHRGLREEDKGQYDQIEDTEYITGCAMLVKREVMDEIGLLDLIYSPMYSEDADYSVRALRAEFRLVYVPAGKVWHKVSAFSGGGLTPLKTRLKVEHNFIFFKRYARWYHWLTIPLCIGGATIVFVLKELLKGNFGIITALLRGFVNVIKPKESGKSD